jgi:hypothetical protein
MLCVGLTAASAFSGAVFSAEIKGIPARDGRVTILVNGEISTGDADAFKAAVKQANDAGRLVGNVRLNSNGGSLLEGVKLADAIRYGKMSTNVGKKATCASACFLVFAAGATKFASYGAQIGVHGASEAGRETVASEAATVSMAKVAKELGVPPAIIGRMVVTPPTEMVWLTPQDLQSMGATMVGRPDQVAVAAAPNQSPGLPQQTAPAGPLDLQPPFQPRATATKSAPSWEEFVDAAAVRSAAQNGGKPAFIRSCQPALKVCNSGVTFLLNEKQMFIKVTRDINDRLVNREVCEINAMGDVRKCLDWDTGALTAT